MIIRRAKEKDLKECGKIFNIKELQGAEGWHPSSSILKNYIGRYFLIAEENNEILGANLAEPLKFGLIGWWFAVKNKARGKGVGTALMNAIEAQAKKDKKHFFIIYSKSKSPAVKFYEHRGYEKGQDFSELIKNL